MNATRLLATAAAMGGVFLVSACDGENLFTVVGGPVATGPDDATPPAVEINSPRGDSLSAKPLGDSVFVSAHVTDDVGIRSVRFFGEAKRGDKDLGTDEVVPRFFEKEIVLEGAIIDTTLTRFILPTPDSVKETVQIIVEAKDTTGNIAADSVDLILGGPDVQLLDVVDGTSVQAGLNMSARVRAQDPLGIIQVRLEVSGAFESTVVLPVNPPLDSVVLDTVIPIPDGTIGPVEVVGVARNNLDVAGQDGPLTLNVIAAGVGDTVAPRLRHESLAPARMELQDSVILTLNGADDNQGAGIQTVGFTVLGISPSRADTLIRSGSRTFTPPRTGSVTTSFAFQTFNVDSLNLPDTLNFEITTYMVDADGNCGAAVGADTLGAFACATLPGGETVADQRAGERITRSVVAGRTVRLPDGGKVIDAAVDTLRKNLLLSNIERSRIETFRLQEERFLEPILVGSAPWGLTINTCPPLDPMRLGCGDTLQVGNSGGTNIDNVYLGPNDGLGPTDVADSVRIITPDAVLFEVERQESDDGGAVSFQRTFHPVPDGLGFSDRPQYLARDSTGRVLYSTSTVERLDQVGTIRKAEVRDGFKQPEVTIFFEHALRNKAEDFWSIANVDNVGAGAAVTLVDHVPGDFEASFSATGTDPDDALTNLKAVLPETDAFVEGGSRWNVENVGFADTTLVSASGDGGWVVFGEVGVDPVGRVIMYNAAADVISDVVEVADLMTNSGETVSGIGLNFDGTLGVVRGDAEVAFFTPDLRRQGGEALAVPGGAGAVLHPLHADSRALTNLAGKHHPDTHIGFVGTAEGTIDIYDTFHFFRMGRIFIRDVVTGPIRASLPFPEDNLDAGGNPLQCTFRDVEATVGATKQVIGKTVEIYQGENFLQPWPADGGGGGSEDRCVVLKLFGTTSNGGVVVVDVRKGDILRNHPSR